MNEDITAGMTKKMDTMLAHLEGGGSAGVVRSSPSRDQSPKATELLATTASRLDEFGKPDGV